MRLQTLAGKFPTAEGWPREGRRRFALVLGPLLGWTMTSSNGATLLSVHDSTHCDAKRLSQNPVPPGEQA